MRIRATILLKPSGVSGSPASPALLERAAGALSRLGFTVLAIGRFGISVEVEADDFQRALGLEVPSRRGLTLDIESPDSQLANLVSKVNLAPALEYYGR